MNIKLPDIENFKKIEEKICKKISQQILNNCKKSLFEQHLKYKMSGKCEPVLDFMVFNILNSSTSHNTDYDFGSEKEPQPKGKDASHPSHNQ